MTLRGLGEDRVIVPVEDSVPGELQSGAEQRQVVALTNSRCRIVVVVQLWCPSRNARTVISPSPSAKVLPVAVNCRRPGHVGDLRFRRDGWLSVPVPEASRRTALWARVSVGDVDDREFFRSVADRAGLSREEATDLTRATLQALAQRLSQGAVRELVLHLPDQLAEQVGGVTGRPSRHSGLAEAEKQVSDRTGLRRDEVHMGFAAVLATLREELSADVFDRVVAQLPREFLE